MLSWLRRSFSRKAGAAMLVTGLLLNLAYFTITYRSETRHMHESVVGQAHELGTLLATMVLEDLRFERYFLLWEKLDRIRRDQRRPMMQKRLYNLRAIAVLDRQGRVAGHTRPREHPLLTRYRLPAGWRPDDEKVRIRWQETPPGLLLQAPIPFGDEVLGVVLLDLDTAPLQAYLQRFTRWAMVYQSLMLIVILLLAVWFGRWLARPVREAVEQLDRLGSGRVSLPGLREREDEFRILAQAIEAADQRITQDRATLQHQRSELEAHSEQLEARVRARTRELEEANRELAAFSYSVSHDLRSPLRAVDGFAQALTEECGAGLNEQGRHYLERIRAGVQRMGNLIDDMLTLSRVSRRELRLQTVDLSTMACEIRDELQGCDPARRVTWQIQPNVTVRGDPKLLGMLMRNLLENAWKYTSRTIDARIVFGCEKRDGESVYFVQDNGAGFDMRYADKLFGVFQRLHGESEFPGTGVGLAIVERVLHRHGGRIWAEAEVGKGATFRFVIGPADGEHPSAQ